MHPPDKEAMSVEHDEEMRRERAEDALWTTLGTLYRYRRLVIGIPFCLAVITAIITLFISNYYRASSTVLLPEGGSSTSALLSNLSGGVSSLLGGASGDYVRYRGIIHSRSALSAAVDSFNLVQVYQLEEETFPQEEAVKLLSDNLQTILDQEFEYLKVSVADKDPERAATLANFFVRYLNSTNALLASQNAANYRRYIERRVTEAYDTMGSILDTNEQFQRDHGVYDLPAQIQNFFQQIAALRASAVEAEIQHEVLRIQYGEDNAQVQALRNVAESANSKYMDALEGKEHLLPIPQSKAPDVMRQYMNIEMDRVIQQTILEVLAPIFEQARLQEEQDSYAVQVLDIAVPPTEKAGPKRTITVLASGLSTLILTIIYILSLSWWRNNAARIAWGLKHAENPDKGETLSA